MALFSGYIIVWALLNPGQDAARRHRALVQREAVQAPRNLIPCIAAHRLHRLGAWSTGWATATECRGLRRARLARRSPGGPAALNRRNLLAEPDGRDAPLLHDHVHPRRRVASSRRAWRFTGIPRALAEWVASLNPSPYALIAMLAVVYIVLGTALDGISMIVLTTSIVLPMIAEGRLRPGLVRHLHRAAGRDRRAHAAGRLQPVRAADHDRHATATTSRCASMPVLLHDGARASR